MLLTGRNRSRSSMRFQSNKDDVKRSNKNNLPVSGVVATHTEAKSVNSVAFGVETSVVPPMVHIPEVRKERYQKKVSKSNFVQPSDVVQCPPNSMILPMKTNQSEVVYDSQSRDLTRSVYPLERVEPFIKKLINQKTREMNGVTKEDMQKYVDKAVPQQLSSMIKTKKTSEGSVEKKDIKDFVETALKNYTKMALEMPQVEEYVQNALKNQVQPVSKDNVDTMIKKATQNFLSKQELMEVKKVQVTKEEFQKTLADKVSKADLDKSVADKVSKADLVKSLENRVTHNELTAHTKSFLTNSEAVVMMDEKIEALNMEHLMKRYMQDMINEGEEAEHHDEDSPKTAFEEIIEPAVARILHRVMKYDQAGDDVETKSLNLDLHYGEVYDEEQMEQESFRNPELDKKAHIDNPLYSVEPSTPPVEESVVEMGAVYNKEETVMFENELRSSAYKNRRWTRFGNGIDTGNVIDIFLDKKNRKIYIAGHFRHVNRIPIENIAVYDIASKEWKHVGEGIPQLATSIAVDEENEQVYVGGVFSKVGKHSNRIDANNIAMFDVRANKWCALGDGLNRDCSSIVYDAASKKLYAGGSFTHSGSRSVRYVGVYDPETRMWSSLAGGSVNGPCRALLKPTTNELYLGGLFTHANDGEMHVSYVAKYDLGNNTWHDLAGGLQGYCNTIAYDSKRDALYVGGTFTNVGYRETSLDAHHVAQFNMKTSTWNNMDGGVNNVVQSTFYDANHDCLYVGGTFTQTFENNLTLNYIAKYDPSKEVWQPLDNHFASRGKPNEDEGNDNVGLNGVCKVISMDKKSLFIAGKFQIAGNITANSIARYALN